MFEEDAFLDEVGSSDPLFCLCNYFLLLQKASDMLILLFFAAERFSAKSAAAERLMQCRFVGLKIANYLSSNLY